MIEAPGSAHPVRTPETTEVAFRAWLRRLVTGTAELAAFDAGEIDAVMDRDEGCAHLLPEARGAPHNSNPLVLGTLDALPGEICVLDSSGMVVMANKAWRLSGVRHARAGLDVRRGENFFAACRDAPDNERVHADAVAAGLRQVLGGTRQSLQFRYSCPSDQGTRVFTLGVAAVAAQPPVNVLVTRDWQIEAPQGETPLRASARVGRIPAVARVGPENRLLAALPPKDYAQLADGLEPVTLTYGEVLYEPGDRMREVYFPGNCLVSLLTLVEGQGALEVGLVGREGMTGARLALGASKSSMRALVQGTGTAMRMKAERFLREFHHSQALRHALLKFTDMLMVQISQTAACNRFHFMEARLARWLMMTAERMGSMAFHMTHGFLADMLGVRREGVTVAAIALQRRGIIRYRRGNITILDHPGLEAACCSCYRHLQTMDAERH